MKPRDLTLSMMYAYSDAMMSGMYFAWAKSSIDKAREYRRNKEPRMAAAHVVTARDYWRLYLKSRTRFCANVKRAELETA